jgi:hypothetical protein
MRTAVVVGLLLLAAAGCGSDQRSDFRSDMRSLDGQVQRLGHEVGSAINGAATKTNGELAAQFDTLSRRTRDLANRIDDTDPPGDLKPARDRLSRALRTAARDLRAISTAAANGDGGAARAATMKIARDAPAVADARVALSRAASR